ncbi:unnamed protein product [Peniophora sp. CBMAI 1063]|nr:unnamed protein product [Peniophora sp. CBMAI 1063]
MSTSAELDRWPTYSRFEILPVSSGAEGQVALVTAIAFCHRGDFLAVASVRYDGQTAIGLIQVYAMNDSLSIKRAVNIPAHPTVLVWYKNILIIGDRTGDVTLINCDSFGRESDDEQENWAGGEIRAIAISGNCVALGTPLGVYIAKLRMRPWYRSVAWYDRKVARFPGPSTPSQKHCPVSLSFTSERDLLVVTYERDGIVLFDPRTGSAIHRIPAASDMIGSSALSPRNDLLAATNLEGGIDVYALEGDMSRYDYTLPLQRKGLNRAIPILFIHEGSGMLVGSTHGVARVLSSRGSIMQLFTVDSQQALVQEIGYVMLGRRHYMAFGTADANGQNVVAIYRSQEQATSSRITRRKMREGAMACISVSTVLLLAVIVTLGSLALWRSIPRSNVLRQSFQPEEIVADGYTDVFGHISDQRAGKQYSAGVGGIDIDGYEDGQVEGWRGNVDGLLWWLGIRY